MLLPARILYPETMVKLSLASTVSTVGTMTFTGSVGTIETLEDLYWDGTFMTRLPPGSGEYRETVWDWLSSALGYCSTYAQLVDGIVIVCPHEVKAEVKEISLSPECGHYIVGRSDHKAEMYVKSYLWGNATDKSSDSQAQPACPTDDSDGGGGSLEGSEELDVSACSVATCITYYWTDTGEVVSQTCYCSG